LSGSLPITIRELQALIHLQLNHNQLEGSIPTVFTNLNHLKRLYLNNNQLSGTLDMSLVSRDSLEWLYLNNNQLSGNINYIPDLLNIKRLHLQNNRFYGSIPLDFGFRRDLEELYLNDNQLTNLNIKNGNNTNLAANVNYNFTSNPDLTCIEVDSNAVTILQNHRKPSGAIYSDNCSITVSLPSSQDQETFSIYPNPATSTINTEEGQLEIVDLTGNLVLSTESNGKVDVSSLETGVYILFN